MPERERTQERAQRRRRVAGGEQFPHPAVPQHAHVIDRVGTGDHPADQRRDLRPGVRALVGRHAQPPIGEVPQPARSARRITGTSPPADTRFGSSNEADTAAGACLNCIYEMPLDRWNGVLDKTQFSLIRGHSRLNAPPRPQPHRWIEASTSPGSSALARTRRMRSRANCGPSTSRSTTSCSQAGAPSIR